MKRWTASNPCPICGGHPNLPRGHGKRCTGYLSDDAEWAYCTREERAGGLEPHGKTEPPAYVHRLHGPCRCGKQHGPALAATAPTAPATGPAPRRERRWTCTAVNGAHAVHVRVERADGKRMWWEQPDGTPGLNGLSPKDMLYRLEDLAAHPDWPVVVVEGEPAADALREAVGTTHVVVATVCGAPHVPNPAVLQLFYGRDVTLWADNDDDGRTQMSGIAGGLHSRARLGAVDWPGAPEKGDAANASVEDRRRLLASASEVTGAPAVATNTPANTTPTPEAPQASWRPVDLGPYLRGEITRPEPSKLARADGVPMLYDRKLHWISGEPESGKSWLALLLVAELLRTGERVLYQDFETDPLDVCSRLLALGLDAETILPHLVYIRPYTPMDETACGYVLEASLGAKVAVLDGVNAAMSNSGFDPNSTRDFHQWWAPLGLHLQQIIPGPVVCIDHVVKDPDKRGAYASGTGQKLAAVDVHLGVEKVKPFGLGISGKSRIVVHKDRPGALRQHAENERVLAMLSLASDPATHELTAAILPPETSTTDEGEWRPTALMERISRFVEAAGEPPSQRAIRDNVQGKKEYVTQAANYLVQDGYLSTSKGTGRASRATLYLLVKPYRQPAQPTGGPVAPDVAPTWPRGHVAVGGPVARPPVGDGATSQATSPPPAGHLGGPQLDDIPESVE